MRLTHLLTVPAAAGAIILLGMSSASAGRSTAPATRRRKGPGRSHANSICAFSGQDGDGAGFPGPAGPPQNWGHDKGRGATPAQRKASGFQPGPRQRHSGFLAGGGGEPAP